MADVIVIGKEGYSINDVPQVIYCGKSGVEAREAASKTGGRFKQIYEISPMPIRPFKAAAIAMAAAAAAVTPVEPEAKTEAPKRTKKSLI
jgi:hypothetical protein